MKKLVNFINNLKAETIATFIVGGLGIGSILHHLNLYKGNYNNVGLEILLIMIFSYATYTIVKDIRINKKDWTFWLWK